MIKIGDFARLGHVSVVTLRHYDEMGLLKPVVVDTSTGYRYYSTAQLPRLNRILALKDLGFTLEQIEPLLTGDLSAEQLRGMLKMKQAEVEQQIQREQARLDRISARLRQIELEDTLFDYDIVLKMIPAMQIASCRVTIPTNDKVPAYIDPAFVKLANYLKRQGAKTVGHAFAIWHQSASVLVNEVAEIAFTVDRPVAGTELVNVYELPPVQVASVARHGVFKSLNREHSALLNWVENNHYHIIGPYREIYINHNRRNMAESATEIQYPIAKAN